MTVFSKFAVVTGAVMVKAERTHTVGVTARYHSADSSTITPVRSPEQSIDFDDKQDKAGDDSLLEVKTLLQKATIQTGNKAAVGESFIFWIYLLQS